MIVNYQLQRHFSIYNILGIYFGVYGRALAALKKFENLRTPDLSPLTPPDLSCCCFHKPRFVHVYIQRK